MKRVFYLALLVLGLIASVSFINPQAYKTELRNVESEFVKGFKDGYPDGYRHVKGKDVAVPATPVAPIPKIDRDTYKDGYQVGFLQGIEKAKSK